MDKKIVDAFHIEYEKERTWENNRWMGFPILTCPFDLMMIQDIIFKVKPDFIIETGTCRGGSAIFYAGILDLLGHGEIITSDITNKISISDKIAKELWDRRVTAIESSSISQQLVNFTYTIASNKTNLVILDSWHTKDHVLQEMRLYAGLVSIDSYMIVQDTHVSGHPVPWEWGEGPWEAVEEFLKYNHDFVIDKDCEKLGMTFHPNGYLRRIK